MINEQQPANHYTIISTHEFGEVRQEVLTGAKAFFSKKNYTAGDCITTFEASAILATPNYLTIQLSDNKHFHISPEFLQYANHSCNPNVFFDTDSMQLICVKEITAGDELCFFYPSSEWDMAQAFECNCGSSDCLKIIKGAKYIAQDTLSKYQLTSFIQSKKNV
jgi:hypothetical protein